MKKGKKLNILLIICLFLAVLIILCFFFKDKGQTQSNGSDKELLAMRSYSNYAHKPVFRGQAIFTDGTIYSFNQSKDTDVNSKDEFTKMILEEGKKSSKHVTKKDLETINEYKYKIKKDLFSFDCTSADQGSYITEIWIEKDTYRLEEKGDCKGTNSSNGAKKVLSVLNKYLKDYDE